MLNWFQAFVFACLLVAPGFRMPHTHSAAAKADRAARARARGFLIPKLAGAKHVLVDDRVAPAVKMVASAMTRHAELDSALNAQHHHLADAARAAKPLLLEPQFKYLMNLNKAAGKAKHEVSRCLWSDCEYDDAFPALAPPAGGGLCARTSPDAPALAASVGSGTTTSTPPALSSVPPGWLRPMFEAQTAVLEKQTLILDRVLQSLPLPAPMPPLDFASDTHDRQFVDLKTLKENQDSMLVRLVAVEGEAERLTEQLDVQDEKVTRNSKSDMQKIAEFTQTVTQNLFKDLLASQEAQATMLAARLAEVKRDFVEMVGALTTVVGGLRDRLCAAEERLARPRACSPDHPAGVTDASALGIGAPVRIFGLEKARQHNDKFGRIASVDTKAMRAGIRIDPETCLSIKFENIEFPPTCPSCRCGLSTDACFACGYGLDNCGGAAMHASDEHSRLI